MTTLRLFACRSAFAGLAFLCAQSARGDGADGGVPPGPDASSSDATAAGDAGPPPPGELATPPELAAPTTEATSITTPLVDTPAPAQAEPSRPITRRLWFWLAVTGVVVGAVAIGIALQSPTVSKPECPTGYVCPP